MNHVMVNIIIIYILNKKKNKYFKKYNLLQGNCSNIDDQISCPSIDGRHNYPGKSVPA